jgi:hypothetical protein
MGVLGGSSINRVIPEAAKQLSGIQRRLRLQRLDSGFAPRRAPRNDGGPSALFHRAVE